MATPAQELETMMNQQDVESSLDDFQKFMDEAKTLG